MPVNVKLMVILDYRKHNYLILFFFLFFLMKPKLILNNNLQLII